MSNKEIAETILNQLGGTQFLAMTGSHSASIVDRGLTLKLRKNVSKAQYLHVILNDDDTYTMRFMRFQNYALETVKEIDEVYCDRLGDLFSQVTGMRISL